MQRRTPEEYLAEIKESKRGKLKVYVGAAPGVGKTYKMLQDAHDLYREGMDIVIGYVETHGRKETEEMIGDLEQVPMKIIMYKEKAFQEVDVEAIKKRAPHIVVIDELAHTNIPGSKHSKRFQDIEEIIEAGIDVFSAMNIQHLESVHDIVQQITGVAVRERVPDTLLQKVNEIQLIDIPPEMLQKRLLEGKIYKKEKIERSLHNFFTLNNLGALRELALREVADDVDEKIHVTGIKERILVCVQNGPTAEKLIRRGWRMANRLNAELYIVTVERDAIEDMSQVKREIVSKWEKLSKQFHATFLIEKMSHRTAAKAISDIAKKLQVTQILLGQSARTRWEEITKGSIVNTIMRETKNIDIHIVSDDR
ncbi:KdpD-like non-kinase potassium sensor [Priestia taiwanensis]|uniref:Histidine kinase n=1 Tax=Priestia taiwanensis TaxID=1347902 RepID=A0A917EQ09_9BACI|nr:KdpD-like non-kinase potassium sensor [Priestia taiwanensis]MBM7364327.1 two-component system sensor histidine kinase KdpD [Priestia taiwanensis]GGE73528.1 histidine kinase [Priestia taiwanensis]